MLTGAVWTGVSSRRNHCSPGPDMNNIQNSGLTVVIIASSGKPAMLIVAGERTPPAALRPGERGLAPGEILRIARAGQTFHVVSGGAWITFDGQDKIAVAGQKVALEPGPDAAVVSALGDEPLVYRLYEKPGESG